MVQVLRDEGSDRGHQLSCAQQDVEQNIEGDFLILSGRLSLHAGAVESDVPVCEVFKEGEHMAHDIVESVVVHLLAHIFDHVLRTGDDVLIQIVCVLALEHSLTSFDVEDEGGACALLQASDILNAEAIRVEPRQEDIAHDSLHTILGEFEGLSTHHWTVAKVEATGIGTESISNQERVRVVLL